MYQAKILADSVSPAGHRLTTFELTYPRIIHAEMMTHRVFSRNAASSRAIPAAKLIQAVIDNPFVPEAFTENRPGMTACNFVTDQKSARNSWLGARDRAVFSALELCELNVHKQHVNRLLEPFQWYTAIFTGTDWANFLALRTHADAQPEIQRLAFLVQGALEANAPEPYGYGDWHAPLLPDIDELWEAYPIGDIKKISAGRCARVSYLTHDGKRDPQADIELCDRLIASGHMSPLEHVATPSYHPEDWANLRGWAQMRRFIPNEANFSLAAQD